jgi:hypothetical protein
VNLAHELEQQRIAAGPADCLMKLDVQFEHAREIPLRGGFAKLTVQPA